MERFSLREQVLLGSSPRGSLGSPKIQSKTSDKDFNDVFGGPPRRSSMHEWRNSLGNSNSSDGEEETINEKPVFGDENINRRSFPSDDFFHDIFKGDENSISTTPTRHSKDAFFSNPSSRVLSPARPLPPQSESFGGSSLPLLLGLPTKLAKGMDQAFDSPIHCPFKNRESASSVIGSPSSPSFPRVSSQVVQRQQDLRNDAHPSLGRTTSSREFYLNNEGSSKAAKSDKRDTQATSKKDFSTSVVNSNGNDQFHFSIYKWPSNGIPLVMHLRGGNNIISEGRDQTKRMESELSIPVGHGLETSSQNEDNSADLNKMKKDTTSSKFVEEVPQSEPIISSSSRNAGKGIKSDSSASGAPMDTGLCGFTEKDIPVSKEESCISGLKPSHRVGKDESSRQGKMVKEAGLKEGAVEIVDTSARIVDSKKVKKQNGKWNLLNLAEATSSSSQDSSASSKDKLVGSNVKGKVKEFVNIFNQESLLNHVSGVETTTETTKVKVVGASRTEDQPSVCETNADNKEKGDKIMEQSEKLRDGINKNSHKIYDTSSERNSNPTSCSETSPEVFVAFDYNMDDSQNEDLQPNCLVEELPPEHNRHSQSAQHVETIQTSDAKIRKWSNGKQGNIRSLLSTLQYVLWPESGWKPVPLVDIIEGSAVRRAYQKALLCLHPDKLQQKGAAPHQKYVAEKVFDILQEAWTHYNSLGSL